ncbi:hypothetical protein Ocin01_17777 [Orchesella cincta]|uniref:Uncharacterized protein n=1 Tax=Orchesella cincta TaxID=48709 RepID=A0A1D2M7F8_ORCCI|nr:hypothetical protein Ocin01_17777 [Orchesella cincta]
MSESEVSSDTAVIDKSFQCKQCKDGRVFTAEQKDEHRAWHKAQREREARRRPSRSRMSPVPSEVTLFEPISSPPGKKKRRSTKTFNTGKTSKIQEWVAVSVRWDALIAHEQPHQVEN